MELTGIVSLTTVSRALALEDGRLTSEVTSGPLEPGSQLVRLNDRVVVVASVEQPLFRDLTVGSQGSDVAAARKALAALGFGPKVDSAVFDAEFDEAVRAWQASNGSYVDGVIRASDLVAATFPAQARTQHHSGDLLIRGEEIAVLVDPTPHVEISLAAAQRSLLHEGQEALVLAPGGEVSAQVALIDTQPEVLEDGTSRYSAVVAMDELVELGEGATVPVRIVVADHGSGIAVPTAAIRQLPSGEYVVDVERDPGSETSQEVEVRPLGDDGYWTLVEGAVASGDRVRFRG